MCWSLFDDKRSQKIRPELQALREEVVAWQTGVHPREEPRNECWRSDNTMSTGQPLFMLEESRRITCIFIYVVRMSPIACIGKVEHRQRGCVAIEEYAECRRRSVCNTRDMFSWYSNSKRNEGRQKNGQHGYSNQQSEKRDKFKRHPQVGFENIDAR